MNKKKKPFRWDLIAKARAQIQAGFYDDPSFAKMLSERCLEDIIADINSCPVGEGDRYRDLAAEAIVRSLGSVVDPNLTRKEFPTQGGRGDIELPLRTESISEYPLWNNWCMRFGIKSIVIETKNTRDQASVRDIQQTLAYVVTSGFGRFGMVVSQSGFSPGAMKQLCAIASCDEYLLLPLEQHDLVQLLRASDSGASKTMEFLRRKETLLLQAA